MWIGPEAREKLRLIVDLVGRTIARMRLARARGTTADRARVVGFGMEVLVGLSETFEIDRDFRHRMRTLSERWLAFQGGASDLNKFFASVLMSLERLDLLVRAL